MFAATGDFDGDGNDDILWRGNAGQVIASEMQNGNLLANHNLPTVSTYYRIDGVQDFNSDGDADVLWRGNDGSVVTWDMQDFGPTGHVFGVVSNAWQIHGTGEFGL